MSVVQKVLLVIVLIFFGAISASAQNPISWTIKTPPKAKANSKISAAVTANISGGWHVYSITQGAGGPIPTRISVTENSAFKSGGAVRGTAPRKADDPNFGIVTETYENSANFTVPVAVAANVSGAQPLEISVRFQACDDSVCLPPKTVKLSSNIEILSNAAPTPTATPTATPTPTPTPTATPTPAGINQNANLSANTNQNSNAVNNLNQNAGIAAANNSSEGFQSLEQTAPNAPIPQISSNPTTANFGGANPNQSFWSFIWLAIGFGALSLLTPCVFPMIPITVSYFTNHTAGSRSRAVRSALIYALGIILTFTGIGVLVAVLFGASGIQNFAASPWVNLSITAVFIGFALSLFGAYEIGVPSNILTKLDAVSRSKGENSFVGLILMGVLFSITSFTCTAPFVGTLLVGATQGAWLWALVGMLAFSTVFALPFFVLALAPQLIAQLPRSGGWLNSIKVVMGFLEIAAALKFLSNADLIWNWGIFTREVVLAAWTAIALLIALYLLGFYQTRNDSKPEHLGVGRILGAIIFGSLALWLLTGLFGAKLGELESFLPPRTEHSAISFNSSSEKAESVWLKNDFQAAMSRAKTENKPVFIDFTGYTCTNCRWMETNMFPKPNVQKELENFVKVQLYTDGEGEPFEGFQKMQEEKFGTVALPLYAILSPNGAILARFEGLTRNESEFVTFLKAGNIGN